MPEEKEAATPAAAEATKGDASQAAPNDASTPELSVEEKLAARFEARFKDLESNLHSERTRNGRLNAEIAALAKERGWADEDLQEFRTAYNSYERDIERGLKAGVPERILRGMKPQALAESVEELIAAAGKPPAPGSDGKPKTIRDEVKEALAEINGRKTDPAVLNGSPSGAASFNYKEHLKSGKPMPPAAEIDRMTASYLRG